jgi:hypothetical protein
MLAALARSGTEYASGISDWELQAAYWSAFVHPFDPFGSPEQLAALSQMEREDVESFLRNRTDFLKKFKTWYFCGGEEACDLKVAVLEEGAADRRKQYTVPSDHPHSWTRYDFIEESERQLRDKFRFGDGDIEDIRKISSDATTMNGIAWDIAKWNGLNEPEAKYRQSSEWQSEVLAKAIAGIPQEKVEYFQTAQDFGKRVQRIKGRLGLMQEHELFRWLRERTDEYRKLGN